MSGWHLLAKAAAASFALSSAACTHSHCVGYRPETRTIEDSYCCSYGTFGGCIRQCTKTRSAQTYVCKGFDCDEGYLSGPENSCIRMETSFQVWAEYHKKHEAERAAEKRVAEAEGRRETEKRCQSGNIDDCVQLGRPQAAVSANERACELGDADACYRLGLAFLGDKIGPPDVARAGPWLRRACEKNIMLACRQLVQLIDERRTIAIDQGDSLRLHEQLCHQGEWDDCLQAAQILEKGRGVPVDSRRSAQYYYGECEKRDRGCEGLESTAPASAYTLYLQTCRGSSVKHCSDLGRLYFHGLGVDADRAKAFDYYRRACAGGDSTGCVGLESIDIEIAYKVLLDGCQGTWSVACAELGRIHEEGIGRNSDKVWAIEFYRRGCMAGVQAACEKQLALEAR
jgi:TPR repeat protein